MVVVSLSDAKEEGTVTEAEINLKNGKVPASQ
jgi:hypothetical protein